MLNAFSEIRPSERKVAYPVFFIFFGIMAGHALMETARDALFLSRLPATHLPWVYLAVAIASLLIFTLQQRRLRTLNPDHNPLGMLLLGSSMITLGFWVLVLVNRPWTFFALYTWSGVFTTLIVVRFWIQVGELFTVTQAKRIFAPIGVGGVLGAILGAALARILTMELDARFLLLASGGILGLTAVASVRFFPKPEKDLTKTLTIEFSDSTLIRPLRTIWDRPYLRRVGALLLISTVTLTFADFYFKFSVAKNVAPESLGSFFASTYLALNLLSLLAQVTAVNWLVRTLGVNRVLSILPSLMILGATAVLAGGGLVASLALKGFDGTFRHSLHRTAVEVLFVPLTGELRSRVKGLIDVLGQRGGQTLASLCILFIVLLGSVEIIVPILVVGFGILWVFIAGSLKTHYLNLFRETLNEVSVQTRFDFPELDLASLEALITALNSPNDREVLATLDLLAEQDRTRLIPALILYHPSPRVVVRSLELFSRAGRDDFVPITDRLLEHHDPEVRAGTLRALSWVAPQPSLFEQFEDDPSPIVRATAWIGMVSYGSARQKNAQTSIDNLAQTGLNEEKIALARAIRYSPGAGYETALLKLADSESPRLKMAVAQAMQEILSPRFVPSLLEMLPDRHLRTQARATLVAMGNPVIKKLDEALGDENLHPTIRRQIPRTISQFSPPLVSEILMRNLVEISDGSIRYRVLIALGRLLSIDPTLPVDTPRIEKVINETLEATFLLIDWQHQLLVAMRDVPQRDTTVRAMIASLLEHKQLLAMERLFRLLGVLHPKEDLRSMYRGIQSPNQKIRSSSQELLEELLKPPYLEPVLALVDDVPEQEKLRRAGSFYTRRRSGYQDLLRAFLKRRGVGLRCLAIYHIGELLLQDLAKDIEALGEDPEPLVAMAVSQTMELLTRKDSEKV